MKKGDRLVLVDGSAYIFRAYHALPSLTRKQDNLPVGAVLGFCNMLWKLAEDAGRNHNGLGTTHLAIIFDHSSASFRRELYPAYKANRPPPPTDLTLQFGLIRMASRAFDIISVEMEGFEADDLIATYARIACEAGAEIVIVSSDKDLMQLVKNEVSIYDPMKNKKIGIAEVIEKWGVPPEKLADLQALMGDSTDNIPGAPGVGPKTASKLLEEYGDLETLLAQAERIDKQKLRETIIANVDNIRIFRKLVELKDDVPVTVPLEDFAFFPAEGPRLISFLKAMEFSSLARRVAAKTGTDVAEILPQHITIEAHNAASKSEEEALFCQTELPFLSHDDHCSEFSGKIKEPQQETIWTVDDFVNQRTREARGCLSNGSIAGSCQYINDLKSLEALHAEIRNTGVMAFDFAMDSIDPMRALIKEIVVVPFSGKNAFCIPFEDYTERKGEKALQERAEKSRMLRIIKDLFNNEEVLKVTHDAKPYFIIAARHSLYLRNHDDVMLMSCALDSGMGSHHDIDSLRQKWLEKENQESSKRTLEEVNPHSGIATRTARQAEERAVVALNLWKVLKPKLLAKGMLSVYEKLERPLPPILAQMERLGILIDSDFLSAFSLELEQKGAELENEIHRLAGETFMVSSPGQLGYILFEKMKLYGGEKTKTGQWRTSADVLQDLAIAGHELPRKALEWRQLAKLKSTYTDALPNFVNPESGRVHTSYTLAVTTTGRLSSLNPNLQNIPVRTEEGRKIRKAFLPAAGFILMCADYSQIELRILAHVAAVPELRKAFAKGIDIHSATASAVFGVPLESMTPDIRHRAKAINFGIIYGISAFGLARQLSIPRGEAAKYIKDYFLRFPGIESYMKETISSARENGYVCTVFGRRIHYPEINTGMASVRAFNERAAINARLQGTAADIIRRAMIRMEKNLLGKGLSARMLLQVHDELVFEVPEQEMQETEEVVRQVMENAAMPAVSLMVPLRVDISSGKNWDEAH